MYSLWKCDQTVGGEYEPPELVESADPLWDTLQLVARSDKVFQFSQLANGGRDALKCKTVVWETIKKFVTYVYMYMYMYGHSYDGAFFLTATMPRIE